VKLQLLRGRKREVIATFERTPNALVSIEPEVEEGCLVEELEIRDDYVRNLAGFYKNPGESARK
jgi:hypothetical protein